MHLPTNRGKTLAVLGLMLGTLCWGGNSVAARLSIGDITPFTLSFWRWTLVFFLLIPFTAKQVLAEKNVIFQHKGKLLLLALTSISSFNTLLYLAAQTVPAVNIALMQVAMPFICILLSIPILRVFPRRWQCIGLIVAGTGLMAIFSRGNLQTLLSLSFGQGDMIMLVAVTVWALYTVLLKYFSVPLSGLVQLTVCVGMGTCFIAPFYLWEYLTYGGFELNLTTVMLLGYVSIFASIIAYSSWNFGVVVLGASQTAMFNFLIPVFAALIAIPVLGEALEGYHLMGATFIFTGLWLSNRR